MNLEERRSLCRLKQSAEADNLTLRRVPTTVEALDQLLVGLLRLDSSRIVHRASRRAREDALRATDITEPIAVLILHQLANQFGTVADTYRRLLVEAVIERKKFVPLARTTAAGSQGIHDPAAVEGTDDEKAGAFNQAFCELMRG